MAEAMLSLSTLPREIQEQILEHMSVSNSEIVTIEIDGEVYYIPFEVMGLIEGLHKEIVNYREQYNIGIEED